MKWWILWISCMHGKCVVSFFLIYFKKEDDKVFLYQSWHQSWRLHWIESIEFNAFVRIAKTHDQHRFFYQLVNSVPSNLPVDTAKLNKQMQINKLINLIRKNIGNFNEILPAASLWMYWFNADDNWLEFSRARHTFRICGGILSITLGSHRAGVFNISFDAETFETDTATRATNATTIIWYSILIWLKRSKQINFMLFRISIK